MDRIRVMLADDNQSLLRLLEDYLSRQPDIEVVAAVSDAGEWVEVEALRFDALAPGDGNSFDAAGDAADSATGSMTRTMEATLDGVRLLPGKVLIFRWAPDAVAGGEALGVDDVSLSCAARPIGTVLFFANLSTLQP